MKRFWKTVSVVEDDGGWSVRLDTAPVRTPARRVLIVPRRRLADGIAAEWSAQDGEINPLQLPFTRTGATCLDRVAPEREAVAAIVAAYAETDLLCYRAERPAALAARQAQAWDPLLAWAARDLGATLEPVAGVMPHRQPEAALRALASRVAALDAWHLTALAELVTISGSLVLGLAVLEGACTAETAWQAARIDEQWNIDEWGEDEEAAALSARRARDFLHSGLMLRILDEA